MFKHIREQEERSKEIKKREEQAKERAYQSANSYQRNMFDEFNDYRIQIGGKSVWFECEFSRDDVYIRAICFNNDFKLFESHGTFEKRVKEIVKKRTNNLGYSGCPSVYFRYC